MLSITKFCMGTYGPGQKRLLAFWQRPFANCSYTRLALPTTGFPTPQPSFSVLLNLFVWSMALAATGGATTSTGPGRR